MGQITVVLEKSLRLSYKNAALSKISALNQVQGVNQVFPDEEDPELSAIYVVDFSGESNVLISDISNFSGVESAYQLGNRSPL